jgi:hypothetical protein
VGQADPSLGDSTLAPYPGLAATLAHGMDFFDRPSGVVIPQFASSLSASLGGQSSDGTQDLQASNPDQAAASTTTTSSRDYDHFSDPVAGRSPAPSAYDGFSDALGSAPSNVGGLSSDAFTNSQVGPRSPNPSNVKGTLGLLWDPLGEVAASDSLRNAISAAAAITGGRLFAESNPVTRDEVPGVEWASRHTGSAKTVSTQRVATGTDVGATAQGEAVAPAIQRTPSASSAASMVDRAAGSPATEIPNFGADIAAPDAAPTSEATNAAAPSQRVFSNGLTPAQHIAANRVKGKAEEIMRKGDLEIGGLEPFDQPLFRTDCGLKFRLDFLARKPGTDLTTARRIEIKSSATAPLTPKQKAGIAIMDKNGANLVTRYPGIPGGLRFPPGNSEILRPGDPSFLNENLGEPPGHPLLPGDEPKPDDHPIKILKPGDL